MLEKDKEDARKHIVRMEPSERWVRGQIRDEYVVDCKRPLLVWEHKKLDIGENVTKRTQKQVSWSSAMGACK